ncbi:M48 family metallopeptidase [Leptolyngbya sp. KIOST-1]|uniref:M48 family metallopeptidase n=1 Tax=Leptolyngbya sp. KIOST-1 TaxID=1229172 RepID=UPI00055D62AC|nr:SprT family zinc-dependent metalloprotease [Leptolyngbya sp. KIOST-1]
MQLDYDIVYSPRRKTLTITVERDRSVVVRAPVGTSPEKINQLVNSRRQWLYEKINHPQKYQVPLHPPGKELVNGESLLYLGRSHRLELVDTVSDIQLEGDRLLVPSHLARQRGNVFQQWYIQQAKAVILPRVNLYAKRLGVTFNHAKITNSKFRWGSCTPNDNVTFNWRLIKAPMFVIDYIVVHELVHFLEPNHTPRFWGIIRSQLATMDKAKRWLKEHGALLEQTL